MNVEGYGLEEGTPANFIVLDAENEYEAVRKQASVLYSIREGNVIAETKPKETTVHLGEEEHVKFEK